MSETSSKCNRCGMPLPPDAPEGLCPRCLVALNLATQTDVTGETDAHGTPVNKPPPALPLPPAEIAKLFPQLEILECLGRGGMGAVYKVRQPRLDRLVALKILSPEKQGDSKFAERFEREARALARLHHPNIVTVYDFGEVQGNFFLLMEFVDGLTLRQLFQARKLSPAEALNIVPKICEALQYAHEQGIVHRDIKPENILLDKKGQVKIADFGIAKIIGHAPKDVSLTGAKDVVGTPHYMAPEQIEKPLTVDHRADIYSLGVVFYEMLTGELPLGKFLPPSQKVQVDVRLDEVVLHALEKEPERRYQQANVFQTDVETIAQTPASGSNAREHAPSESQNRPRSNGRETNPWQPVVLVVGALLCAAVLLASLVASPPFNWIGMLFGPVGLIIAVVKLAGLWPFPSAGFPQSNFARRNWPGGKSISSNAPPIQKTDRFWRWFAVAVLALISIPIIIAILGLLAAIAIPNFVRARQHSQAVHGQQLAQEGWKLWQAHKLDQAEAKFNEAIQFAPDDADAWNGLGWAEFNSGKTDDAEKAFQKVVSLQPNHPAALNGLGQINLSRGNYDAAEKFLLKAAPQAPAAWFGLARLYLLEEKFDPAEKWAQKIADSGQGDDIARQMLNAAKGKHLDEGLRLMIEPHTTNAPAVTTDQVMVEHLALRMLAAIRDKDDAALKEISTERVKGWRDALPQFAFELREKFHELTGKPFDLHVSESLVRDDTALVKCAGPTELNGKYLVLFFVKTSDGWKNCYLHNALPSVPLEDFWKQMPKAAAIHPTAGAISAAQNWLGLVDSGQYAGSWQQASESFHAMVSQDDWVDKVETVRKPLGKLLSRKLETAEPNGSYFVVKFDASFEELKAASETVTSVLERDGQWRTVAYLIVPRGITNRAAVEPAQNWLRDIDNGNYAPSWTNAAAYFQSAITSEKWVEALQQARKPLGPLVSRAVKSAQEMTSLPDAPDGRYIVMQFETSFANKKSAIETVTFMLEKDEQWKSAGYFIK